MKIKRLETFCDAYSGFVRLTDETGAEGWGQVSSYNADITCQILHRQVAPWALGADTEDLEDLLDIIEEKECKFPGSYIRRAMGGVDTAIWDLDGKRAGKPVVELLGGTPGRLRAYASSMSRAITPEDEAVRLKRLRDEQGFTAFKFRIGSEVGRGVDEWPGRTEAIIPAVCNALGRDVDLMADANSCFSPARAIAIGRTMEDHGMVHFEEPCPYWKLDQTKEVADALDIDVTGGEQDSDLRIWRQMIAMRAVDVVQPDVCYMGGIARTLKVARIAAEAGLPVTPHSANLSMVTLFSMHLLRAIPNPGKYLEFSIEGPEFYPWQVGLFRNDPYAISDGHVTVSGEPGWGVEIAPEWLARSRYQKSELA